MTTPLPASSGLPRIVVPLVVAFVLALAVVIAVIAATSADASSSTRKVDNDGGGAATSKEGFEMLNDRGSDLMCGTMRGNLQKFGGRCGMCGLSEIAAWSFASIGDGGVVRDSSAYGMHLQTHGGPTIEHEAGRLAMRFDGRNDHLTLVSPTAYLKGVTGGFTVTFWYKQAGGGPSHYEPFVVLYKDSKHFVAVTDHWSDHRVDIKTANNYGMATTQQRGRGDRWIHCAAVFSPDKVRLVLSENDIGDRASREQSYDLSAMLPQEFDKIMIGYGPGWVIPIRTVSHLRAHMANMQLFSRPLSDDELRSVMRASGANDGNYTVGSLDARGHVNVNGRLHFSDEQMDTGHTSNNSSDSYWLERVKYGGNNTALKLTMKDDSGDRFEIWGDNCSHGGCDGPGRKNHQFKANGDAWHRGEVRANKVSADGMRVDGKQGTSAFNHGRNGHNFIRGTTEFDNGAVHINGKRGNTHFNYGRDGKNYIRGPAQFDNGKVEINGPTDLNGKTTVRGDANVQGKGFVNGLRVDGDATVRGDTLMRGNANVNGRLHFSDNAMNTDHNSNNSSDSYWLERVKYGGNNTALKLTMKDDSSDRFEIWGDNCSHGGCDGPGRKGHQFRANGNVWHRGRVKSGHSICVDGECLGRDDIRQIKSLLGRDLSELSAEDVQHLQKSRSTKRVVGETGRFRLNNAWGQGAAKRVNFRNAYINPVIVAYIATRHGGNLYDVRVRDVDGSSCEIFGEEDPHHDAWHVPETVCYIVVESGLHHTTDGQTIQAGLVETRKRRRQGGVQVHLDDNAYDDTPAVLHTLNTYNNGKFMTSAVWNVHRGGFRIAQESVNVGYGNRDNDVEKIAWVAFKPGVYKNTEAGTDPLDPHPNGWRGGRPHVVRFSKDFGTKPDVVVKGNTVRGGNGYWTRSDGAWDANHTKVRAVDSDYWHKAEIMSWVAAKPNTTFHTRL